MSHRVRRRLVLVVVAVVVLDLVVVFVCVTRQGWGSRALLGTAAVVVTVYLARLAVILGRRAAAYKSVALTLLAPVLPLSEAVNWLPELEGQITEAGPRRHRALVLDAIHGLPQVWLTAWGGRARDQLVWLAVRCTRPTIMAINQVFRSPDAVIWPNDRAEDRLLLRQYRRLRRNSAVLTWCLGDRHEREIASRAHKLTSWCHQAVRAINDTRVSPHLRAPTAVELALLMEINHNTMVLAGLLDEYRRGGS